MDCPICGTSQTYETTSMLDTQRHYLCRNEHWFVDVEFVHARWMGGPGPASPPYCGPAAHLPAPPTPEDLLSEAARLYAIRLGRPG